MKAIDRYSWGMSVITHTYTERVIKESLKSTVERFKFPDLQVPCLLTAVCSTHVLSCLALFLSDFSRNFSSSLMNLNESDIQLSYDSEHLRQLNVISVPKGKIEVTFWQGARFSSSWLEGRIQQEEFQTNIFFLFCQQEFEENARELRTVRKVVENLSAQMASRWSCCDGLRRTKPELRQLEICASAK